MDGFVFLLKKNKKNTLNRILSVCAYATNKLGFTGLLQTPGELQILLLRNAPQSCIQMEMSVFITPGAYNDDIDDSNLSMKRLEASKAQRLGDLKARCPKP